MLWPVGYVDPKPVTQVRGRMIERMVWKRPIADAPQVNSSAYQRTIVGSEFVLRFAICHQNTGRAASIVIAAM